MSNEYKDWMEDLKNAEDGTEDFDRYLVMCFPFLCSASDIQNGVENPIPYFWYNIDDGWRKAFGLQMFEELREILEKWNYLNDFFFIQIKEKFGELRMYCCGLPEGLYEDYCNWEKKYRELSIKTCVFCGEAATCWTTGWILPVCDNCKERFSYA